MNIKTIRELFVEYINCPTDYTSKNYILLQIETHLKEYNPQSNAEQSELIKLKEFFALLKSGRKLLLSVQNGDNDNPISTMVVLEYLKDALFGCGTTAITTEQYRTFQKFMLQFVQIEICTSIVDIMLAAYGGVIDDQTYCFEERCSKDKTFSFGKPDSEFPAGVEVTAKDIGANSLKIRQYTVKTTDGSKIYSKLGDIIKAKVLHANQEFETRILEFVQLYFTLVQKHIACGVDDLNTLLQTATTAAKKTIFLDGYLSARADSLKKLGINLDELCAIGEDNLINYLYQVNAYIDMGVPADCICIGKIFSDPVASAINGRMSPLHTMFGGMIASKDTLSKLNATFRSKLPEERRETWRKLADSFAQGVHSDINSQKLVLGTICRQADDKLHKVIYGGPITKTEHDSDYTLCVCGTTDEAQNIFGAPFNMVISPDTARSFLESNAIAKKIVLYTQLMKEHEAFTPSKGNFAKSIYGSAEHQGLNKAIARQEAYETAKGPATSFNIGMNLIYVILQYPLISEQLIKPAFIDPQTGKIKTDVPLSEANCLAPIRNIWLLLNEKLNPEIRFIDAEGKDIPGKALELIVKDYLELRLSLHQWENNLQQESSLRLSKKF